MFSNGMINGHDVTGCGYWGGDDDADEQYYYCKSYTPKVFKWHTKDGKVLSLHEMETNHIINAIKYTMKQKAELGSSKKGWVIEQLVGELRKRKEKEFFDQKRKCPYCKKNMTVAEIYQEPEIGGIIPKYNFICKCGSCSPEIKRPTYSTLEELLK